MADAMTNAVVPYPADDHQAVEQVNPRMGHKNGELSGVWLGYPGCGQRTEVKRVHDQGQQLPNHDDD